MTRQYKITNFSLMTQIFLLIVLASSTSSFASGDTTKNREKDPWFGVALSDVKETRPINQWIRQHQSHFLDGNIKIIYDTVHSHQKNLAISLAQTQDQQWVLIPIDYQVEPLFAKVADLPIRPLEETEFKIDVDIYHRQVVIRDLSDPNEFQIIFPIAHGGLNVFESRVTTPLFKNAFIDKNAIIDHRYYPKYFKGEPFLRITTSKSLKEGWTGIGFHILQNDNLVRRPDSHGCIRLRAWDLHTFHKLMTNQPFRHTPLDVHMVLPIDDLSIPIHPYFIDNSVYQREKNFASKNKAPLLLRDRHGLIIYESVYKSPVPRLDKMVLKIPSQESQVNAQM